MKKVLLLQGLLIILSTSYIIKPSGDAQQTSDTTPQSFSDDHPLFIASATNNCSKINELISLDHNLVNAQNTNGSTALHFAAHNGHATALQTLINAGANINAQNIYGATPLHFAAHSGRAAALQTLINAGANINAQAINGYTPLHNAAQSGHATALQRLLHHSNENINAQTAHGNTPLHFAAQNGNLDCIQMLIFFGANTTIQSLNGLTPLDVAIHNEHITAAQEIRRDWLQMIICPK